MGRVLNFPEDNQIKEDGDQSTEPEGSPSFWWADTSIWADRNHVAFVYRETEDDALTQLYKQAKAMQRFQRWRNALTGLERKVVACELDYMRQFRQPPPIPTPTGKETDKELEHLKQKRLEVNGQWGEYYREKWQWIAKQLGGGFTPLQVRALLDEASRIMTDAETLRNERVIEYVYTRKLKQYQKAQKQLDAMEKKPFRELVKEALQEMKPAA